MAKGILCGTLDKFVIVVIVVVNSPVDHHISLLGAVPCFPSLNKKGLLYRLIQGCEHLGYDET